MNERMGLMARLAVAEGRLAAFAESPPPGLTDPDPATGERWDAGQAWAHVAEFVPYWQTSWNAWSPGLDAVPIPCVRADHRGSRSSGSHRGRPPPAAGRADGAPRQRDGPARTYLVGLSGSDWSARGVHARRGEMTVAQIVERFVVGHLEEHAEQLEKLAANPR